MPNRSQKMKLKTGDYVEVLVPLGKDDEGNPVFEKGVIPRASMMDEKWEDVKARAEGSGRLSTVVETKGARVVPDEGPGDSIKLRDKSGALVVIPRGDMDEASWWKRVVAASEKDSFEGATLDGEDIRTKKKATEKAANLGAEEPVGGVGGGKTVSVDESPLAEEDKVVTVPPENIKKRVYDPSMESATGGGTVGSMMRKLIGGAVEGATPQPGPGVANTGGGAAGPGPAEGTSFPPQGESLNVGGLPMMKGATPQPGPGVANTGGGAAGPGPAEGTSFPPQGESLNVGGLPMMKGSEPPPPLDMTGIPAGTGKTPMQALGDFVAEVPGRVKQFGQFLSDRPETPQPGAPVSSTGERLADPLDQPSAPAFRLARGTGAAPPTSTSAGLKVSGRTGPSGKPEAITSLDRAEQDFIAAQRGAAENAQKRADEQLKARVEHEANLKKFEAEQAGARIRQREAEDRINQAYLSTLEEMSKKAEIDPDHFWSSKSVGQKAFMAIGGFLAGLGGRDPSGRLDQMIQQDIAVQRENFNLAREGNKMKLAGLDSIYAKMRQQGLDDREAAAATRASMNESLARRLEGISEQMAPGEAKAKAEMAIAQFRMNKVKAEDDLKNSANERWARYEALRLQNVKMEMSERAAIEKAKKPTPMQATLSKEMAALEDALASLRNMKSLASGGFVERARTQLASGVPGGGILDPNRRAKARTFKGEAYADMIQKAKGALQEAEIKRLSEIVPQEISAFEDPAPYFERAIAFVEQQIARRKERYDRSGPDIRGESAGGQGGEE